jgi:hypothetical protein
MFSPRAKPRHGLDGIIANQTELAAIFHALKAVCKHPDDWLMFPHVRPDETSLQRKGVLPHGGDGRAASRCAR